MLKNCKTANRRFVFRTAQRSAHHSHPCNNNLVDWQQDNLVGTIELMTSRCRLNWWRHDADTHKSVLCAHCLKGLVSGLLGRLNGSWFRDPEREEKDCWNAGGFPIKVDAKLADFRWMTFGGFLKRWLENWPGKLKTASSCSYWNVWHVRTYLIPFRSWRKRNKTCTTLPFAAFRWKFDYVTGSKPTYRKSDKNFWSSVSFEFWQ